MHCEVEVNGRLRRVGVERAGGLLTVTIDGRTWRVDAARVDPRTWSVIVLGTPDGDGGASYEVTLTPPVAGALAVSIGGATLAAAPGGGRRARAPGREAGDGPQRVTAPMPGKIVRVLVAAGDTVQARQGLVVIEAMKMENELRADRPGTVARVHVQNGASVEAGTPLIEIR